MLSERLRPQDTEMSYSKSKCPQMLWALKVATSGPTSAVKVAKEAKDSRVEEPSLHQNNPVYRQ